MSNIVGWAKNKWMERLMKWEDHLAKPQLAMEMGFRGDVGTESCDVELLGKGEEHLESDHMKAARKNRIREDDKKLLISPESCNVGLPIDRSPIQSRERSMERRGPPMKRRGPDGAANLKLTILPEPFQILLRDGMSNLFPAGGARARVHDWVSLCLSSEIPSEMVTHEEFKLFIKDLVSKCEAIGMDFCPHPRCSLWPTNMSMSENLLVLVEQLGSSFVGNLVQLVLIVLPHVLEGDNVDDPFKRIKIFCEDHGVIYLECLSHDVRMRSNEFVDFTAWRIKHQAIYLDSIKKTEGDSKAAGLRKENPHGYSFLDDETQEDDGSDKRQGGDGGSMLCKTTIDENRHHVDSAKEIGGDGGSKEWKDSCGFHGSVDEMESIDHSILQVNGEIGNVKSWACISFSMNRKKTFKFLEKLVDIFLDIGMGFYPVATRFEHVKPGSSDDVEKALWRMHDKISEIFSVVGEEIGLLFVILPDKKVGHEIYGRSKKVCQELGIVYHCFSPKDARNPSEAYLKTTAYEINNKVVRRDAVRNFVMPFSAKEDDPTIVFGAEIFCDSNISIASVVSTFDWPVSSRYNALVAEQPCKEVTIKNLHNETEVRENMVRCCLIYFFKKSKMWPSRIIFFRNGVDEGQLRSILSQEIDAIQKACTCILTSTLPITYVVVGRAESAVGEDSCPAMFEFSCSHPVVGGTNTVSYRVFHDENKYDADKLQSLCTNLCTNRVRWAQPDVSMAPPAYYAHLAALEAHAHFRSITSSCTPSNKASYDGELTTSARQLPPVC